MFAVQQPTGKKGKQNRNGNKVPVVPPVHPQLRFPSASVSLQSCHPIRHLVFTLVLCCTVAVEPPALFLVLVAYAAFRVRARTFLPFHVGAKPR